MRIFPDGLLTRLRLDRIDSGQKTYTSSSEFPTTDMFDGDTYRVKQKIRIGEAYNIYEEGEHVLSVKKKKFRLKEDVRFTDTDGEPVLRAKASQMLDMNAAYAITDERTGEEVGAVKRDWKSMFKHHWELLDSDGNAVARITEDSVPMALARRYVTTLIPFRYHFESHTGIPLGSIYEKFSFRYNYTIDLSADTEKVIDHRLGVAAAVLIDAIEGN